ncbi:MAG: hypothetical protein AAFO75_03555 [Pseudomonadota bacterium]
MSVVNKKDGDATRFTLSASWVDLEQPELRPAHLVLRSGTHDTSSLFPKLVADEDDKTIEGTARLDGIVGAQFIQSIMVRGADIEMTSNGGRNLALSLPGPVPNLVRASYLNCSGDLFRPVGEGRVDPR